ncbi:MAG: DNA polymerase III subunit gamma/tau [Rikenellaceae bacterium]
MDNFVVSARKYRPASFVSVVGQSHITSTLRNAIDRNQLAHAYLFCGPRGVGKTTCARIFAKNINCSSPREGEACQECESCRSFNEGRSFSIHELDAASNNSVDDIRNLTDQVRIPPQTGRYSVYIIDEVHMLSQSAFNAFLKTLEEPPAHAIFILATTEKHKILPTILSRCQIYDFNRIKVEDTVGYLKYIAAAENVSYDDESLNIIARKADGGMRDALSMFDKVVSFCDSNLSAQSVASTLNMLDYDTYFNMTDIILSGDYQAALVEFDRVLSNGFSGSTFVSGFSAHFRDLLMCKDPKTISLLEVTGSVAQRYKQQSEQCSVPLLFESISLLNTLDTGYKTSSNQRLYFELGLMKLCGLGQKKNNDTPTLELPPLVKSKEPAVVEKNVAAKAEPTTVQQEPAVQRSVSVQQEAVAQRVVDKVHVTPAEKVQTVVSEAVATEAVKSVDTTQQSPKPTRQPRKSISISGASINTILSDSQNQTIDNTPQQEAVQEDSLPVEVVVPDEQINVKIENGCSLFISENEVSRPRFAMAFSTAVVEGNVLTVKVANQTLAEEIVNGRFEILGSIAKLGGVSAPIELKVEVSQTTTKTRPIKVEDKIKFLVDKNPDLLLFKQALNLDVE